MTSGYASFCVQAVQKELYQCWRLWFCVCVAVWGTAQPWVGLELCRAGCHCRRVCVWHVVAGGGGSLYVLCVTRTWPGVLWRHRVEMTTSIGAAHGREFAPLCGFEGHVLGVGGPLVPRLTPSSLLVLSPWLRGSGLCPARMEPAALLMCTSLPHE